MKARPSGGPSGGRLISRWGVHRGLRNAPPGVKFALDEVVEIDPVNKRVKTLRGHYDYDWLVVGTGCCIKPDEVEGKQGLGVWLELTKALSKLKAGPDKAA